MLFHHRNRSPKANAWVLKENKFIRCFGNLIIRFLFRNSSVIFLENPNFQPFASQKFCLFQSQADGALIILKTHVKINTIPIICTCTCFLKIFCWKFWPKRSPYSGKTAWVGVSSSQTLRDQKYHTSSERWVECRNQQLHKISPKTKCLDLDSISCAKEDFCRNKITVYIFLTDTILLIINMNLSDKHKKSPLFFDV